MSTSDEAGFVRREEDLAVGKQIATVGSVHAYKRVEVEHVGQDVPREVEHATVDRVDPSDGDSGQIETLPDGSISIPVLEEELVVTKRTVVRERIVIRKDVVTEIQRVEADLRREHVDVDGDAAA